MAEHDVFLGVLSARSSSAHRPYQEQTTFFRRLVKEGSTIGVGVFVFSPPDVSWKKRRIAGWTWTGARWVRRRYRFPHAIFDRVSPKGKVDLRGVAVCRKRFARLGIPRFNTGVGSKWQMHKLFVKNEMLRAALPPTKILTVKNLREMMEKYGEVYIKPSRGGQGKGVAWAKRAKRGYVYRLHGGRGSRSGRAGSIRSLKARCGRGRLCVVQKAIPLLTYDHRVFDVRALTQRFDDGEWRVTGLVARLGGRRSRVTNIHAGGKAVAVDRLLEKLGVEPERIEALCAQARRLALEVAKTLSQAGGNIGELGIDLAIDRELSLWLIEANSRTGRISFHRAGLTEIAPEADRAPAAYARFLAERRRKRRSGPHQTEAVPAVDRDAEADAG